MAGKMIAWQFEDLPPGAKFFLEENEKGEIYQKLFPSQIGEEGKANAQHCSIVNARRVFSPNQTVFVTCRENRRIEKLCSVADK
ncbi:MAG TPA: hypothetical protein P5274_00510 [Candidatus Paceibacterota bacterium]|nr:hypothetical protein [Candidatus Paceibacterota bacterium]